MRHIDRWAMRLDQRLDHYLAEHVVTIGLVLVTVLEIASGQGYAAFGFAVNILWIWK